MNEREERGCNGEREKLRARMRARGGGGLRGSLGGEIKGWGGVGWGGGGWGGDQ